VITFSSERDRDGNRELSTFSYYLDSFYKNGFDQYSYKPSTYKKGLREQFDKVSTHFVKFKILQPYNNQSTNRFYNDYIQKTEILLENYNVSGGNTVLPENRYLLFERPPAENLEPDEVPTFKEKKFIILQNPQYKDVLNDIYRITEFEYKWLKHFYDKLIRTYWATFPASPLIFKGSMDKLHDISKLLFTKGFISKESSQHFEDYLTGKKPSGEIRWLKTTSSFTIFIEQLFIYLKKPKGNKTWGYFENNPIFLNQYGEKFSRLRNFHGQVNPENYDGKAELDVVLKLF